MACWYSGALGACGGLLKLSFCMCGGASREGVTGVGLGSGGGAGALSGAAFSTVWNSQSTKSGSVEILAIG